MEELAVAFNNMAAAMQNADTARQEFVANVSHELKTPMTTIAGYLDGMLDGTIPQPEQRHYMELVSTEVRRLSRLVRNMLEISRLKDQGIPADKLADFDLCEAAGQALLSFEQRINRKHLNVDVDMPELGVTVRAMPDAVTQVLYNLIDNAVKFIDDGGTLSIRVERSGNKAVTTVGNTGPTIAPEELPLIFDRFHKTDQEPLDRPRRRRPRPVHRQDHRAGTRRGHLCDEPRRQDGIHVYPAAGPLTGETKPRKEGVLWIK